MADVREPVDHARAGRRIAALFVLVAVGGIAATVLARTRWWLPPLATEQGAEVDRLIYTTLVVTGIVFVLVHLLLATFVWRSAAREGGRAEHLADHPTLELTYTLVPAAVLVTLIAMGAVVWSRVHSPAPRDALVVEVRAEQFSWLARYPGPDGVFGRVRADLITRENWMGLDPGDPAARQMTSSALGPSCTW